MLYTVLEIVSVDPLVTGVRMTLNSGTGDATYEDDAFRRFVETWNVTGADLAVELFRRLGSSARFVIERSPI